MYDDFKLELVLPADVGLQPDLSSALIILVNMSGTPVVAMETNINTAEIKRHTEGYMGYDSFNTFDSPYRMQSAYYDSLRLILTGSIRNAKEMRGNSGVTKYNLKPS